MQCPTCGKELRTDRVVDAPHRPFCSDRCQKVDLGKWLREEYRISDSLTPTQNLPEEPIDPTTPE
jgi:uncharacterized protein